MRVMEAGGALSDARSQGRAELDVDVDVDVVCKSAGRSDLLLRKRLRIAVGHDTTRRARHAEHDDLP
jgi:hypothetical protein